MEQPDRYEIKLANQEPGFRVASASSEGLVLHRFVRSNQDNFLELIRLDTTFHEMWQGSINIDRSMIFVGGLANDSYVYFLFHSISTKAFELIRMDHDDGQYRTYNVNGFIRFSATEFRVTKQALLIGGYFNRVPLVLYYDLATRQSRILPGLLNEDGELTQVKVFEDDTFQVLISGRNYKKQKTIWIKNYRPDGTLIDNYTLEPEENVGLIFGRSTRSVNDMQILSGVYGHRNSEYSRGLFITSIDPTGLQQTKYYNFGDLENFFNYMKAKRSNRIKERIERRKIRGKKVKFNYRFLIHEVIEHDDQFIVLGEAFYPQYSTVSNSSYRGFFYPRSFTGNPLIRGDQVFDGYRYTHAIIIGFDKDGNLLWDNSFEINDVKTYFLEQFVRFSVRDDKITLLYLFDNQIRTKIIRDNQVLEGQTIDPIRTLYEDDKLVREKRNNSHLNYWYGNNFYAYGIHEIENESGDQAAPKRRVFFVNKINP
ncbi:MAG TPA: hypothetical protein VKZ75_01660 [Cyclobacteriaceae bacterium]|nr:hypothetical protein [Cyclobacteriaceae bacterium]